MSSQLTPTNTYHLSYQIPRIVLGSTGRNKPFHDGQMKLVSGTTHPIEFYFSGEGNKPLNLRPYKVKLLFWLNNRHNLTDPMGRFSTSIPHEVLGAIVCDVTDPYSGTAFALISSEQTERLHLASSDHGVRWGVFLITDDNQVFPMAVSSSGETYGEVQMTPGSTPPVAVIIGS